MNNREIKFRCFDTELNKIWEVDQINFYDELIWVNESPMTNRHLPLKETPLMQYTGLIDKNGKEIYEGDIVRIYAEDEDSSFTSDHLIGFHYCWFSATEIAEDGIIFSENDIQHPEPIVEAFQFYEPKDYEVIGNIYQNPELYK